MYPPAVSRGQYWRLLTSGFLHADYMHLIFNMLTLYFFGRVVEVAFFSRFGSFAFLLFYLMALVFSDLPTYIKHRNNTSYTSLGASGAVAAVL
nr:rhomboid family intramembrane serine protease [Chitinophagaceae bacterium]